MTASNARIYHSDSFKVIYIGSGTPTNETEALKTGSATEYYAKDDQTPHCSYSKSQIYRAPIPPTYETIDGVQVMTDPGDPGNVKPNPFTIQYIDEDTGNIYVLKRPSIIQTGDPAHDSHVNLYSWTSAWE